MNFMRMVVDLAVISNRKIVLARKQKKGKSSWILPGGKPEKGESDLVCLTRELSQEIPFQKFSNDFYYYGSFKGISPNKGDIIETKVYLYETLKILDLRPSEDSREPVRELKSVSYDEAGKLAVSDTTKQILDSLKQDFYL